MRVDFTGLTVAAVLLKFAPPNALIVVAHKIQTHTVSWSHLDFRRIQYHDTVIHLDMVVGV